MRVLMTGGGTGGHINPAIAIANTIKQNHPDAEIAFVGTRQGKETELLRRTDYKLYYVEIQGIRRSLSPQNLITAWYILTAPRQARRLIKEFKPDIVIGTGGYASWPALVAAARLGIPTIVHESNALPGMAVKRLQKKVDRILVNFEETKKLLNCPPEKVIKVGNPLRGGFGGITSQEAKIKLGLDKYKCFVMSFGGSLGAAEMNRGALELMRECAKSRPDVYYQHAVGVRYYKQMRSDFSAAGLEVKPNVEICDYIYDMPLRMAAADIVITRAGAVTISELALMKKAAIIIPSPNVVDNHQYKNAKLLADAGAALLFEEKELRESGKFASAVLALADDPSRRRTLGDRIEMFADKDANKLIYIEIQKLLKSKKA